MRPGVFPHGPEAQRPGPGHPAYMLWWVAAWGEDVRDPSAGLSEDPPHFLTYDQEHWPRSNSEDWQPWDPHPAAIQLPERKQKRFTKTAPSRLTSSLVNLGVGGGGRPTGGWEGSTFSRPRKAGC